MGQPSPFYQVGKEAVGAAAGSFKRTQDFNTIDQILADSAASGDPGKVKDSISQILTQVSPERQEMAMKVLQDRYSEIVGRQAAEQAGVPYGASPQVQAQLIKQRGLIGERQRDQKEAALLAKYPRPSQDSRQESEINQEIQDLAQKSPIINRAINNPRVYKNLTEKNKIRKDIENIQNQIDLINDAHNIRQSTKNDRIKQLYRKEDQLNKRLDKITEVSKEDKEALKKIRQEGNRARQNVPRFQRVEELIPKVSKEQPFTIAGRVMNPLKANDRARVESNILTPEEQEFSGLIFQIITDTFETLPRIKTEFETIMDRNLSILQTEEGNKALLDTLRKANEFIIKKNEFRNELENAEIPSQFIDDIIDEQLAEEEKNIIRFAQQKIGNPEDRKKARESILFPGA